MPTKNGYQADYIGQVNYSDILYAYFDYESGKLCIFTYDGVKDSPVIALDEYAMIPLIEYAKNHFPKGVIEG